MDNTSYKILPEINIIFGRIFILSRSKFKHALSKEKMQVTQVVEINSSSKEIFDYLLDVENRKNYVPALEEVIMLDPLPIKKGSRYIEVAEIAGRKLETTYQVIALEENKRLSAKTLKSIFPIQANLSLTEKRKTTVLSIELDFQLKGVFKLASGIVKGIVNQQAKEILKKIKQNLEGDSLT